MLSVCDVSMQLHTLHKPHLSCAMLRATFLSDAEALRAELENSCQPAYKVGRRGSELMSKQVVSSSGPSWIEEMGRGERQGNTHRDKQIVQTTRVWTLTRASKDLNILSRHTGVCKTNTRPETMR